ncbi:MAG: 30S ribosomal protein S3 [Methanosarcinaceae archaeon]|nr:30S ribosomal protein S3 [Methanosarcinaceae archaeon]MDD4331662.1 30S ribosomal protein S3 [Methanosarcinaceae archaeon]
MAVEKKFVQDGYVKASMNEYFAKQLSRAGYGGMELNRTPMGTQIVIYSEKPGMVIGKAGKVIRKLTRDVGNRFDLENPQIDAQEVRRPELNAQMMASRLASSIERGWYFRKAGHNTIRAIMNAGALGCEIVISGKLTGARSRVEKFVDGYIKHSGKPVDDLVDEGFAVAVKKLGTLGCKVRIIHPGVVLPDSFRVKDASEVVEEAPLPEEAAPEEVAEPEAKVVEKAEKKAKTEEVAEPEAEEKAEASEEAASEEVAEPEAEPEAEEEGEVIQVEGSDEVRRQVDGVWQHKHEGYDYWHPMARVHKEAKD